MACLSILVCPMSKGAANGILSLEETRLDRLDWEELVGCLEVFESYQP